MKNINLFSKIFLYLSLLSGGLWMGSYFTRMITYYQLFRENQLELKPLFNNINLREILTVINGAAISTIILYSVFIISFLIFITSSKVSLKQNGWLFITTILILVTMPFELYLMNFDLKIVNTVNSGNFDPLAVINLIVERFKVLSSFPVIELFCYFAIIYFISFKPLNYKPQVRQ